jgi:drug/metabolite transporter (DMT)-like permease
MPLDAISLVLVAALLHAAWNIAAKKAGADHRFTLMTALMVSVLWAPVGVWVACEEMPRWGLVQWALVLASTLTHSLYVNVLYKGYRESDLTIVYPVARGTGPLLASAAAVLLLGEQLGWAGALGLAGVTLGVFFLAGGPAMRSRFHEREQRKRVLAGIGWGALTGAFIASYTVIDGYAVKVLAMSPLVLDYLGNLLRIPFILPRVLRDPPGSWMGAWRTQWRYALLLALISPLAYVLVLYAMQMAPLSHVAPAREVSMLFAALLGGHLLGERDRGVRLLGAGFIALGVVCLSSA